MTIMATIGEMRGRIAKLDNRFIAGESIHQTRDQIVLHQQAQMFEGKDRDEHPIHRIGKPADYIYAEQTIRQKRRKGQPVDRVTLRDTRDFYREFFVDVREETFVIDSADSKAGPLQRDYGTVIFGLGKTRKTEYVQESLRPVYVRNFKNALSL